MIQSRVLHWLHWLRIHCDSFLPMFELAPGAPFGIPCHSRLSARHRWGGKSPSHCETQCNSRWCSHKEVLLILRAERCDFARWLNIWNPLDGSHLMAFRMPGATGVQLLLSQGRVRLRCGNWSNGLWFGAIGTDPRYICYWNLLDM
jgi:hypothetical protein